MSWSTRLSRQWRAILIVASFCLLLGLFDCLQQNILINAQSGTEEPLSEPVKHMIISKTGTLLHIVNMDELVDYGASRLAIHALQARRNALELR
jgi:hypothetical protein